MATHTATHLTLIKPCQNKWVNFTNKDANTVSTSFPYSSSATLKGPLWKKRNFFHYGIQPETLFQNTENKFQKYVRVL